MSNRDLSITHIILILMMSTGILNHVIVLSPLFDVSGRDAWVSILVTLFFYFAWVSIVVFIVNKTRKENLFSWLQTKFNKAFAFIFYGLIFIYLFSMITITIKDMSIWTSSTFLPRTPTIAITLSFFIVCVAMANTNIKTIAIVNGILLPIVIMLGFFIASVNLEKKDYSLLFPILDHGLAPVLNGTIYVGIGMVEALTVLFLQHHVKSKIKYYHFIIIGILFAWLTLGPVTGALATFGPIKSSQLLFPAYEQWALGSIGRFVEHFDFFSIFQWLSGAFVRVSLFLFIIVDLINVSNGRKRFLILGAVSILIIVLTSIPVDYSLYEFLLAKYFIPSLLILMLMISFILGTMVLLHKRRNTHHEENTTY